MYTRLSFRETSHRVPLRSGAGSAPARTPHGAGGAAHSRGAILWYRCSRVVPLRLSSYYAACFKAFSFIYLTPRPRRRVSRHQLTTGSRAIASFVSLYEPVPQRETALATRTQPSRAQARPPLRYT